MEVSGRASTRNQSVSAATTPQKTRDDLGLIEKVMATEISQPVDQRTIDDYYIYSRSQYYRSADTLAAIFGAAMLPELELRLRATYRTPRQQLKDISQLTTSDICQAKRRLFGHPSKFFVVGAEDALAKI